jgi:hypothetical protein
MVLELIFSSGTADLTYLGNFLIELIIYFVYYINFYEDNVIVIIGVPWYFMIRLVIYFLIQTNKRLFWTIITILFFSI